MLVLSRKVGESVQLADDIEIIVLAVDHQRVRLGIKAPRHINVRRSGPAENHVDATNREAAVNPNEIELDLSLLTKAADAQKKQQLD